MRKKLLAIIFLLFILSFIPFCFDFTCFADQLSDAVSDELSQIDLSEITDYFESIGYNKNVLGRIKAFISGDFDFHYESVFKYLESIFLNNLIKTMPVFMSIICIMLLYKFSENGVLLNKDGAGLFVCNISCATLLLTLVVSIIGSISDTITKLSNLSEVFSPIIITLMIALGGKSSVGIFSPAFVFLTNFVNGFAINFIIPLLTAVLLLNIISNINKDINLTGFADFLLEIIKWVFGIICFVYSIFISAGGIVGGVQDRLSIKAAKYLLSNSIPIVGGLVKDGFDLVSAGSVLIKNAVGIMGVIGILYTIMPVIISIISISILLKFSFAITSLIDGCGASVLFKSSAKVVKYFFALLIIISLTFFLTFLLIIISFNGAV